METTVIPKGAYKTLTLTTLAFTICFAVWMLNGVLVTFLTSNQVYDWSLSEVGFLIGLPVLTGSIMRLPAGILTDRFGGKPVMIAMLLLCSVPTFFLSMADSYFAFALCSFGFGIVGSGFAIGVAYTALWFPKNRQGLALGIFGAGNAGAGLTTLFAPTLLDIFTNHQADLEGWRKLPVIYAAVMIVIALVLFFFTTNKKPNNPPRTLKKQLEPLKSIRVWRFGLYYFLVFGCFVAFSQWLMPYYVNVYYLDLVTAGILVSLFSVPSGVIRALGGWLSDKYGGRVVMYWVLGASIFIAFLLIIPKMEITSPGKGIMALENGTVTEVTENYIIVGKHTYELEKHQGKLDHADEKSFVFPVKDHWQESVVKKGDEVKKKQLLAKGITKIYFQANIWIFTILVIIIGIIWGIGKAAVYKHIPNYYPDQVGVVGGIVGVIGGLGGFFCPILFGYLLDSTGLWTSSWMLIFFISVICLLWMHRVIQDMLKKKDQEHLM